MSANFSPRQHSDEQINRIQQDIAKAFRSLSTSVSSLSSASTTTDTWKLTGPVTTYTTTSTIATGVYFAVYTGTGGHTLTLPAANAEGSGTGQLLRILHAGSGTLTVSRAGSDTINATLTSFTLTANQTADLSSDGSTRWSYLVDTWKLNGTVGSYSSTTSIATGVYLAVYTGTGGHTITLPAANADGSGTGQLLHIIHGGTGPLTIARAGSDTINTTLTTFTLTQGQTAVLASDGSSRWGWTPHGIPMRNTVEYFDDFLNSGDGLQNGMAATTSGGTVTTQTGVASHPGILRLDTQLASTNSCGVGTYSSCLVLGGGRLHFTSWIKIANLGNAIDRYSLRSGLQDSYTGDSSNGVYFRYADNVNSGNWQCVCRSGGVETVLNTSTAASTSWTRLEFEVNAAGTSVQFWIDGVSMGTQAGIPTAATGIIPACIIKSVGTANRVVDLDAYHVIVEFTTAR